MSNMRKKYNWIPDLPDQRDFNFTKLSISKNFKTTNLPQNISLRKWCSEVENQGQLGSCTANSLTGVLEYNINYNKKKFFDFSRLFIYYNERVIEGSISQDAGAMLRDGIKTLSNQGVCAEKVWPYDLRKWKTKPTTQSYKNALTYKISKYYRLNTLDDMKTSLANYHPFVFGFSVYDSFESDIVSNTGILQMPLPSEKLLGGHAVCCVGYDDKTKRFLIRNSWGKNWGMKGTLGGYFSMPYEYLTNRDLSDDFWTIEI